jgi:hypothetical protein
MVAPRQGRWTRRDEKKISWLKTPSGIPAGVRCDGIRLPVVSPSANIHRPFQGEKQESLIAKDLGHDKTLVHG